MENLQGLTPMLHKWESKSKVENRGRRKIQPLKLKGRLNKLAFPFSTCVLVN
jgi:hypothetical protein